MLQIKYIKNSSTAKDPAFATEGAAALDLSADLLSPYTLEPGASCRLDTGIAFQIPAGYVGLVFGRSGLAAKHQIGLTNGVGVIDSDYTGNIGILLTNYGDKAYVIQPGERLAQISFLSLPPIELQLCDSLSETMRGAGGFGSTGSGDIKGFTVTQGGMVDLKK